MNTHIIPIEKPVNYHLTGKFVALTDDWKHSYLLLSDYELFIITKGILYLEYDNKQYTVSEGEMLLLPPVAPPNNTRKGYESSACSFYWMHFDLDGTKRRELTEQESTRITDANTNTDTDINTDTAAGSHAVAPPPATTSLKIPVQARLTHPEKIVVLMKQLQDMVRENASAQTLNYMTTSILCQVNDDVNSPNRMEGERNTSRKSARKWLFNDIVDHIKLNIYSKLTVKNIADNFGYNEKYISRMFYEISGLTLKQYILQQKAETANFFLSDTNLNIEEIAAKLGYTDSHNFARSYKKQTGFTPSEYRNTFSKRVINH